MSRSCNKCGSQYYYFNVNNYIQSLCSNCEWNKVQEYSKKYDGV